jgi:hypothetical protein
MKLDLRVREEEQQEELCCGLLTLSDEKLVTRPDIVAAVAAEQPAIALAPPSCSPSKLQKLVQLLSFFESV